MFALQLGRAVRRMRCVADFFRTDTRKLVVLLAVAAGAADAILIVRFDVLTAAQTGNTILLAVALATGNWPTVDVQVGGATLARPAILTR